MAACCDGCARSRHEAITQSLVHLLRWARLRTLLGSRHVRPSRRRRVLAAAAAAAISVPLTVGQAFADTPTTSADPSASRHEATRSRHRRGRRRHHHRADTTGAAQPQRLARRPRPRLLRPRQGVCLQVTEAGNPSFYGWSAPFYGRPARPGDRSRSVRVSVPAAVPVSPQGRRGYGPASCSPSGRGRCR
jgi:hypothetical protein